MSSRCKYKLLATEEEEEEEVLPFIQYMSSSGNGIFNMGRFVGGEFVVFYQIDFVRGTIRKNGPGGLEDETSFKAGLSNDLFGRDAWIESGDLWFCFHCNTFSGIYEDVRFSGTVRLYHERKRVKKRYFFYSSLHELPRLGGK